MTQPDPPTRLATIYDVAARSGVSITTVSLALNRPGRVAVPTRRRVLAAVDELGFVPKAAAVAHARQGVAHIGVIAPFTTYASYGTRLNGVLSTLKERPTDVVVYDEESAASAESPLLSSLPIRRRLDGLVIMGLPLSDEVADRLQRQHLPTVLVDTMHPLFSSVTCDDEAGGYLAGRHLVAKGHRRVAFVSEPQRSDAYVSQGQRRLQGLQRALREAGPNNVSVIRTGNDVDGGRDATRQILEGRTPPTAVFAHHDLLAAGILLELRARGLEAPESLAVVGFDDGDLAAFAGLTTIRQPLLESGRVAAEQLMAQIADPDRPAQQTTLGLELVARTST